MKFQGCVKNAKTSTRTKKSYLWRTKGIKVHYSALGPSVCLEA